MLSCLLVTASGQRGQAGGVIPTTGQLLARVDLTGTYLIPESAHTTRNKNFTSFFSQAWEILCKASCAQKTAVPPTSMHFPIPPPPHPRPASNLPVSWKEIQDKSPRSLPLSLPESINGVLPFSMPFDVLIATQPAAATLLLQGTYVQAQGFQLPRAPRGDAERGVGDAA